MRLPSIQQVVEGARQTFRRFPLVMACAALGTLAALALVEKEETGGPSIFYPVLFGALLGLPLLAGTVLVAERRGWSKSRTLAMQLLGVLLLIGYGLTVPMDMSNAPAYHAQRLALLLVALVGFLIVGPYLQPGQTNGFWQYGKTLLFRLLVAGLFSATLFAGLAIALAALDNLFGIDVPERRYGELWILIVGLFATSFFLAGIPEKLDALDEVADYPKGLKVFAQYILLPLMFVYLIILYAYLGKIVIQWSWPQGWVSRLTLFFAAGGIATLVLLHPIREKSENVWIRAAARWFWVIMIPPIVMLMLAITRRVTEYGLTEGRFIGYVLGAWLAAMAVYFIASRTKSIKVIPATLALIALLISFGPWGAFQVSERSQVNRLQGLLEKNQILTDSKIQKAPAPVEPDDAIQISSIIGYLREVHGYDAIQGWFSESLASETPRGGSIPKNPADVTRLFGIEYRRPLRLDGRTFLELSADPQSSVTVAGYERMLIGRRFNPATPTPADTAGEVRCRVDSATSVMTIVTYDGDTPGDSLAIPLGPLADTLLSHFDEYSGGRIDAERMTVTAEQGRMRVKVCLRAIEYRGSGERLRPFAFYADILYSLAEQGGMDAQ
ncbi:MAG TPA: DUF4153 domain-containing protein [bacterium]|nr:DUF4153 domain-containing protein [bacterium]